MRSSKDWRDRRSDPRRPLKIEAMLRNAAGLTVQARLIDISENGCALALAKPQAFGLEEAMSIKFASLEAQACWTVWVKADSVGLRFDKPLSNYVVEHLAKHCR